MTGEEAGAEGMAAADDEDDADGLELPLPLHAAAAATATGTIASAASGARNLFATAEYSLQFAHRGSVPWHALRRCHRLGWHRL
jgi:hypothetical protein